MLVALPRARQEYSQPGAARGRALGQCKRTKSIYPFWIAANDRRPIETHGRLPLQRELWRRWRGWGVERGIRSSIIPAANNAQSATVTFHSWLRRSAIRVLRNSARRISASNRSVSIGTSTIMTCFNRSEFILRASESGLQQANWITYFRASDMAGVRRLNGGKPSHGVARMDVVTSKMTRPAPRSVTRALRNRLPVPTHYIGWVL